jgi:hypothetical protein
VVSLGDFWPSQEKNEIIKKSFIPFQVYYLFCPQLSRPKDKFLLLVCNNPLMFFYISTNPDKTFLRNIRLMQCQVVLDPGVNSFLSHKSFINCSDPETRITITEVKHQLRSDMGRIKNQIDGNSQKLVINAVNQCTILDNRRRCQILKFLQ